jgi:hypothetical protein
MTLKELNFCGIFIAPFFLRLALATVLFVPLHRLADRVHLQRWVWNRPVVEAALFVVVLSLVARFLSS